MTAREWRPGDVAMLTGRDGTVEVGICRRGGKVGGGIDRQARWTTATVDAWSSVVSAQPLVAIDPEDREQVERLLGLHLKQDGATPRGVDNMQAALRSLIEPPKPEEPTGWLARAEDAAGFVYVRIYERGAFPWSQVINSVGNGRRADTDKHYSWSDLDIVRILSWGQP